MSNKTKSFRFDVAVLNPERFKLFVERLDRVDFLMQSGVINNKTVYLDGQFDTEPDLPTLLKEFEDVRYIDYSNVPFKEWKYPFF